MERMLGASGGKSEEARLAREAEEKAATEKAKGVAEVKAKERFTKGVRLSGASEEEIEAGLRRAIKGTEIKDQYPDRPSETFDKRAA